MRSPETQTLYDIFNGRIQYVVPVYQRAYVWNETDNWQPLWDDIRDAVDRYLVDPESNRPMKHFLGAVVLEQLHSAPGGVDQRLLIDGQQRLTTLQVVLAAAAAVARERGVPAVADELDELTLNRAKAASGDLRFKVLPSRRDRGAFKAILDPDVPPSDGAKGIPGAWTFFTREIEAWLTETCSDGLSEAEALGALQTCLDSLLYVVSINLDEADNAQVIFETLNARGTPLTALDLAKNLAFLEAGREEADVETLHDEYWERTFERDDYWLAEIRQGRLRRPRADLFLMHWLTMRLGEVVPATQLFETFRRDVVRGEEATTMTQLVPEICADAEVMRSFETQPAGTSEALFFARLQAMDTTTLLPVALLLFRSPEVTTARRRRALAALESWLVRRTVLRATAKNYNRILASLLRASKANLDAADDAIIEELRSSDAVTNRWPTDGELRDRLEHRDLYGYIAQPRVRMLLEACEYRLRDSTKTESMELPSGLSIEHVMPQSWRDRWPLAETADLEEAEIQRNARVHRLGNLTLVTSPLNSALSNASWGEGKRAELGRNSILLLNQRLCEHDTWDESAIDNRGRQLTDMVIETWPGPDSETWGAPPAPVEGTAESEDDLPPAGPGDDVRDADGDGENGHEVPLTAIRDQLEAGRTPDQIYVALGRRRAVWIAAVEEEARQEGELGTIGATPEAVADLRESRNLRWERIAARVFGDARRVPEVRSLYEELRGEGAASRSYTGRGRRFPGMAE